MSATFTALRATARWNLKRQNVSRWGGQLFGILGWTGNDCDRRAAGPLPCIYPFPNDAALELGKHPEHLEHRFARGRRRIEPLLVKE